MTGQSQGPENPDQGVALNEGTGRIHRWTCGVGPQRGQVNGDVSVKPYAVLFADVPAVVATIVQPEYLCVRCFSR